MWPFPKKLVPVPVLPEQTKEPVFKTGDIVCMLGENPYKGALRARYGYVVRKSYFGYGAGNWVALLADNGTVGRFKEKYFSLACVEGFAVKRDADADYNEALAAQDAFEGL